MPSLLSSHLVRLLLVLVLTQHKVRAISESKQLVQEIAKVVGTQTRSSNSELPPGLQNTKVDYPESRATFVHFPRESTSLLEKEMSHIHSPLVLDVVTTITHWRSPLWELLKGLVHRFRNQNQIIYVRSHHFVGNGLLDQKCREEFFDTDTGVKKEQPVESDDCHRRCTNGGRYCAPAEDLPEYPFEPRLLVEETLRRMCIDDLYHATDLKHWEYLEAFEDLRCFQQQDLATCSREALSRVAHTDWNAVLDCIQLAGGIEQDVMNVRLQEQLDRQQGSYSLEQVPMMHVAGTMYKGPWQVDKMLESVCHAYQEVYEVTPVACDFCGSCQDARKCLWYLECDGTPFSVDTLQVGSFQQNHNFDTLPPVQAPRTHSPSTVVYNHNDQSAPGPVPVKPFEHTKPPVHAPEPAPTPGGIAPEGAEPVASQQEEQENPNSGNGEENVHTSGFFMGGMLSGLVFGLAPAFYFARHEKATRREISSRLAARDPGYHSGSYRDDDLALSSGKARLTPEEMRNMEDITLEDAGIVLEPYKDNPDPDKPTLGFRGGRVMV